MSGTFSFIILILVSVLSGTLLWFFSSPGARIRGGYAVISVDESCADREIRDLLVSAAGDTPLCESSQWVFLDDFGALLRIPLDEYAGRITPFDPRNDGYAEKLHSFFVRDGKRYFFIPLSGKSLFSQGSPAKLEKKVSSLLGGIPFSLEFTGLERPFLPYLVLLVCSGFCALYLARFFLPFIPALAMLSCLAFYGIPGLALAAILSSLGALLKDPCIEFFTMRRRGNINSALLLSSLEPWKICIFLLPFFLAGIVITGIAGGFHPVLLIAICIGFLGIFAFSLWIFSGGREEAHVHVRFAPVLIIKVTAKTLIFSKTALPYAFSALLALLISPLFNVAAVSPGTFSAQGKIPVITEADYRSHADFQASFSFKPLGSPESREAGTYSRYTLGDNGLITGAGTSESLFNAGDIPPFLLNDLMAFLGNSGSKTRHIHMIGSWSAGDLAALLLALLFSVPAFVPFGRGDKNGKHTVSYKEKKIAA
jgi:hypothetical protein